MKKLLLALAAIAASATAARADNVSGNVSGTWTTAGSPYLVLGDVTVPTGSVLVIQAGVQVRFTGHFRFTVNGRLDAQGTQFAPVTFTRHTATAASRGWGIRFVNATAGQSVLRNCVVEYGHAKDTVAGTGPDDEGGGVSISASNVLIEQCAIRNNSAEYGAGIAVSGNSAAIIRRNRIHDNTIDNTGAVSIFVGGAGVGLDNAGTATTVNHNLIYANVTSGNDANYEGGGGIAINGGSPSVTNNTIVGNAGPKGPGIHALPFGNTAIVLANNIVWGNTGSVNGGQVSLEVDYNPGVALSPNLVLSHNTVGGGIQKVYRNTLEALVPGTATLTTDPLLTNATARIFELRATSPAIDAASAAIVGYSSADYYGLGRVDAPAVTNTGAGTPAYADRGAIEWTDTDGDTIADGADNCIGIPNTTQLDTDSDGLGDACDANDDNDPALDGNDCNPTDATIYPGATEACDAVDSNCNGSLVDGFPNFDNDTQPDCVDADDDNDGALDPADCQPMNAMIFPGATEVCDNVDSNCNGSLVDSFPNADGDPQPNCIDTDDDNDGSLDPADCAPLDATIRPGATELCDNIDSNCNGSVLDGGFPNTDGDGALDCVDTDDDNDGSLDPADCRPLDATIFPGAVEACDAIDSDCDLSLVDQFPDTDGDATPDCTDPDDDGDGTDDGGDCAPLDATIFPGATEQCDTIDSDCDADLVDGFVNTDTDPMPDCVDPDDDDDGDLDDADNCPLVANPDQADTDGNGEGDACANDRDGDGVLDGADNCAGVANPPQTNTDGDAEGDACDLDDDGDGVNDDTDVCPLTADPQQTNTDGAEGGDACDDDDDNDSALDAADNCPLVANADQLDSDEDGAGDPCDDSPFPDDATTFYSCGAGLGGAGAIPLGLALAALVTRRRRRRAA